jgi:gas vesicle protein
MKKTILIFLCFLFPLNFSLAMEIVESDLNARQRIRNFPEVVEQRKELIKEKRAEVQERVEREKEILSENINQRKEKLQERIQEIKDEKQRERYQLMNQRIQEMNQNLSQRHLQHLDVLEIILDKIESRISVIEEKENMDLFYNRLDSIREKINQARNKIVIQKVKTYVVEGEEELKDGFQRVVSDLKKDHLEFRENEINSLRAEFREIITSLKTITSKE